MLLWLWGATGKSNPRSGKLLCSILIEIHLLTSYDQGDQVIATARAKGIGALDRLAPLKEAGAAVMELDLTAPEEELHAKAKEAWEIYGQIDTLVNNAAYIDACIFEETK